MMLNETQICDLPDEEFKTMFIKNLPDAGEE